MGYRDKILEEAALMFSTYGIRAVTMDMLAERMAISKRTIYEVFSNKEELLDGVVRLMKKKLRDVIMQAINESDNIIEAIFRTIDIMQNHFQRMSPAFQLDIKRYHLGLIKKLEIKDEFPYSSDTSEIIIRRGIKEGIFRADIDVNIINRCIVEVAKLINSTEAFPEESFARKDVERNFFINYLRGISTPKGLALINAYEEKKFINKE